MGGVAPISVRVNPDVDAKTHKKIATGKSENKFGVPMSRAREVYALAAKLPGIRGRRRRYAYRQPDHRSCAFDNAAALLAEVARDLMVPATSLEHIDFGGGLGIPYRPGDDPPPLPRIMPKSIKRHTRGLGLKLIFEIGRMIVGNAGMLLTRVIYVTRGEAKTFIVIDAAMNDLIRPTLYDAHHEIRPCGAAARARTLRCRRGWPDLRIGRLLALGPRAMPSRRRATCSRS